MLAILAEAFSKFCEHVPFKPTCPLSTRLTRANASPSAFPSCTAQVPFTVASVVLLSRMAVLAASNLTVNEWMNRSRYQYLTHELAGYCNRFDRGIGTNCLQFWVAPGGRDWWAEWERADQVRRCCVHHQY